MVLVLVLVLVVCRRDVKNMAWRMMYVCML
jgi:hypothetical protein